MSCFKPNDIRQARVSSGVQFFRNDFLRKFQFEEYHSPTAPAIFFGCFYDEDIAAIQQHRSARIVVWAGSDSLNPVALHRMKALTDCWHVAISDFIVRDLRRWGLPMVRLPICPVDHARLALGPCRRGPAVYIYTSRETPEFYGRRLYRKMQQRFPDIEFLVCCKDTFPQEQLVDVYKRCFVGMRLVPHDGLPNSVVELGLLGIPTIYNGGLPGSLPYRSASDIAGHIVQQRKMVGTVDAGLSEQFKKFLTLPPDWRTVDYYAMHAQRQPPPFFSTVTNSVRWRSRRLIGCAKRLVRSAAAAFRAEGQ